MRSVRHRGLLPLAALLVSAWILLAPNSTRAQQARPSTTARVSPGRIIDSAAIGDGSRPLAEIIASRVPSVQLNRGANGVATLRLRGAGSFMLSGEPLIVIDGIAAEEGQLGLSTMNPHDVASIEVLTDPASLSLYGMRGSNGVIVVKTKRSRP